MARLFGNTYFVTPSGSASNDGSSFANAMSLSAALNASVAGDEIFLQEGTYSIPYVAGQKNTIVLSKSGTSGNPISIIGYDHKIATIDFSFPEQTWVQDSYGFEVTGSWWVFKNIKITRAGYQGAYVKGAHNTFENCVFYDNRNTGLEINKGGSYTTVINCDAYRNYDPKKNGSMADGFGPKQTQGPGNKFIGCRAWENSDDGYDAYDSPEQVVFENCWAFRNGVDVWNYGTFEGNANGFKVGGNGVAADNELTHCVAFGHPNKGFDQNNNAGSVTVYNCTSYDNGTNYGFGNPVNSGESHTFRNNISLNGAVSISNASQAYNTWNGGFSVSTSDFVSLHTALATATRNADGSLPDNDLFRLNASSNLIDAGVDVGLTYNGSAPDLGAFEYGASSTRYLLTTFSNGNGTITPSGGSFADGATLNLQANPDPGYQFGSWGGDASGNSATTNITMNSSKYVTATFASSGGSTIIIEEYETGFDSYDGDIESDNVGYIGAGYVNTPNVPGVGINWEFCASAAENFTLMWRFANGVAASDRAGKVMIDGIEVESNLSFASTNGWTSWSYSEGLSINLPAGTHLVRLEAIQGPGLANIDQLAITGGSPIAGECPTTTYNLTTSINGQGSVSPSTGSYVDGASVSLAATPVSGWQFDGWSGAATGSANPLNLIMDSHKSITANFSISSTNTITIEENGPGFCNVEGTIDSNHGGFSGSGFVNTDNAMNKGIDWSVNVPSSGFYDLEWKMANGNTENRMARLFINGSLAVSNVDFTTTGGWDDWVDLPAIAVSLTAGTNQVRLEAVTNLGLANIDYLKVTGTSPSAGSCSQSRRADTDEIKQASVEVVVSPVPAQGVLYITITEKEPRPLNLSIYDATGRLLKSKRGISPFCQLDVSGLPEGLYFLKVTGEGINLNKRIIRSNRP